MSPFDRPAFRLPCASFSLFPITVQSIPPSFCSIELTFIVLASHLVQSGYYGTGFPRTTHSSLPRNTVNNAAWRRCVCGTGKTHHQTSRPLDIALPLHPLILSPATFVPEYPYAPPPLFYTRLAFQPRLRTFCPPSLSVLDCRKHVFSLGLAASASVCHLSTPRCWGCCAFAQPPDRRTYSA